MYDAKTNSPKPEKEKGRVDACASKGWENKEHHPGSGCWVPISNVPSQEMPPPQGNKATTGSLDPLGGCKKDSLNCEVSRVASDPVV